MAFWLKGCGIGLAGLLLTLGAARAQRQPQTQAPQPAPQAAQTHGQGTSQATVTASAPQPGETATTSAEGTLVDQVIAVVNGDLILESDVDEERRFHAFQPYAGEEYSRDKTVERLIDRTLILQQAKLQPDAAVTRAEAVAQLQTLRRDIPACKQFHCETDAGWDRFVATQGFTMEELVARWQERMQVLKFVETRFRSGIQIEPAAIKAYYDNTLLPEYARQKATAPKLAAVSDRIQEILLQQQVSNLLGDWLQSLKAQGSVRVMRPGEVQP